MDRNQKLPMATPWVEKHRPKCLDSIAHQAEVVTALKRCVSSGTMPNMLFYGSAGVGKSSAIHALGHELFGPKFYRQRLFEFNASSDRGIKVVRERIKSIAQQVIASPSQDVLARYPCPEYQIIVLDEADALTRDAQAALRRIIEDYAAHTRFCIICNYPSQIIEPIVSRCARFRFGALPPDVIMSRLRDIFLLETSPRPAPETLSDALRTISTRVQGDMRRAVNLLQTSLQLASSLLEEFSSDNVLLCDDAVPDEAVNDLIRITTDASVSLQDFLSHIDVNIIRQGYPADTILSEIWSKLSFDADVPDRYRVLISEEYARAGAYLARRTSEDIVLWRFLIAIRNGYVHMYSHQE